MHLITDIHNYDRVGSLENRMNEAKKDKFVHDKQMIEQNIGLVRSSRTEKLKAARDSNRM